MIPRPAADVARLVGVIARRADTALVTAAARNAAAGVAARRATRLEELRTLRDLRDLESRLATDVPVRRTAADGRR